jgi:hypothetical protein
VCFQNHKVPKPTLNPSPFLSFIFSPVAHLFSLLSVAQLLSLAQTSPAPAQPRPNAFLPSLSYLLTVGTHPSVSSPISSRPPPPGHAARQPFPPAPLALPTFNPFLQGVVDHRHHSPASLLHFLMLTVYIRIKVQVDLQADKSSVVVKGPFFPQV